MAEGQDDERISAIRAAHYPWSPYGDDPFCPKCLDDNNESSWPCDYGYVLARLDALAAERDAWNDAAGDLTERLDRSEQERDAMAGRLDALEAERDDLYEQAERWHRYYVESVSERDALAARLAAAEAALSPCTLALEYRDGVTCREERDSGVCLNHRVIEGLRVHAATADRLEIENRALRRQVLATYRIVHEGLHGGKPTDPGHQEACEMPSCRNARAALAGSREQAGEGA